MFAVGASAFISGFFIGIALAPCVSLSLAVYAFLIILTLCTYVVSARTIVMPLAILGVMVGAVRFQSAAPIIVPELEERLGETIIFDGRIFAEPDERERSTRLSIEDEKGARFLVVTQAHAGVLYGDHVRVEGELGLPTSFDDGSGRRFPYAQYLAKDGIRYEVSFAHVSKTGTSDPNVFLATIVLLKHYYERGLARALPEPHAGLASGITVGDKRGVGEDLADVFRIVGLTHIIVLSGYNIMVVISFLERVFSRAPTLVRLGSGGSIALVFALMTGLAPASLRAALMAVIALIGKATGRTYIASRALFAVSFLMVCANPYILLYDPGFQLSVVATLGLIYVSPIVAARISRIPERFGIREIVASSLGVQCTVLPLLLYHTGLLSFVSIPANIVVLPIVPATMIAVFFAGVFGIVAGSIAPIVALPAYVFLSMIITISEIFAWAPFGSAHVPAFPAYVLVIVYGLMAVSAYPMQPSLEDSSAT